ncbi:hypothetical protein FRC08_010534 [Ceratobasidium sp. 394]|nr:hypothetical protein FRC08_010534 [Ceratobasidium sp. 394]
MKEALSMSVEKKHEWEAFDACVDPKLRAEWATLDTSPKLQRGKWTSVYLAKSQAAMSVTQSLAKLKNLEIGSEAMRSTSNGGRWSLTADEWIFDGVEIERLQHRLTRQTASCGPSSTPAQVLDIT